jgi:hypothetical protein
MAGFLGCCEHWDAARMPASVPLYSRMNTEYIVRLYTHARDASIP